MRKLLLTVIIGIMSAAVGADKLPAPVWKSALRDAVSLAWRPDLVKNPGPAGKYERQHATFTASVPADGWYLLACDGDIASQLRIEIDGQELENRGPAKKLPDGARKLQNLYLSAGTHQLTLWRAGNWRNAKPNAKTGKYHVLYGTGNLMLFPADDKPENTISWRLESRHDVNRLGEPFVFAVTAQGGVYEVYLQDQMDARNEPRLFTSLEFPAGRTETRRVAVKPEKEGVYSVSMRVRGTKNIKGLQNAKTIVAVDVAGCPAKVESAKELIFDVDCVKQTVNGKPLPQGMYYEANGPTRVVTTAAGTYRESHDSTPPLAPKMSSENNPESYSSFAYHFRMPQKQVPYEIDIEFPDDARRNVAVYPTWIDDTTGKFVSGQTPDGCRLKINSCYGKAYYCGGRLPISQRMRHHNLVVWAGSEHLMLALISQIYGERAAAARIRIWRYQNDRLPFVKGNYNHKRMAAQWSEEGSNWRMFVNPPAELRWWPQTLVGMNRWCQYGRWLGMNTINGIGVSYTMAYWRTQALYGCRRAGVEGEIDELRLITLVCEKYGMYYLPDIFRASEYHSDYSLPAAAIAMGGKAEDVWAWGNGGEQIMGLGGTAVNPLHPAVQEHWLGVARELNGLLGDSPAFRGITPRCDAWYFQSDFHFASLFYGYGDWTVREFSRDTGVKVPVNDDDPAKYSKRYYFLTSADIKPQWVRWRTEKTKDYWRRMQKALAGDREDVLFGPGGKIDTTENQPQAATVPERLAEAGIGKELLKTPGIMWVGTLTADSRNYAFPAALGSASMGIRELGPNWPVLKLGLQPKDLAKSPNAYKNFYGSTVFVPAGRQSLRKLAEGLAAADTRYMRWGSNSDHTGDVNIWRPWLQAYTSLPTVRFTDAPGTNDPIVVRYANVENEGFFAGSTGYVYVLNRLDRPAEVEITVNGGKEHYELAPYELKVKKYDDSVKVTAVRQKVTDGFLKELRGYLAYLENNCGKDFERNLREIWRAYQERRYADAYFAATGDNSATACAAAGAVPGWIEHSRFPNKLEPPHKREQWCLADPTVMATGMKTAAELRPTEKVNPLWVGSQLRWSDSGEMAVEYTAPGEAEYTIRLGYVVNSPTVIAATLNGEPLPGTKLAQQTRIPDQAVWNGRLRNGKNRLVFRAGVPFGVYIMKVIPKIRAIRNHEWSVIGPFSVTATNDQMWGGDASAEVRAAMEQIYPCQKPLDLNGAYKSDTGKEVRWSHETYGIPAIADNGLVSFLARTDSEGRRMNFAITYLTADRDVELPLYIGCEWWANAYLNGEKLPSHSEFKESRKCGAEFSNWYPKPTVMKLKKGVNELLVKVHGGSFLSYFVGFIGDDAGVSAKAVK